ncbi:hypothetical protein CERSUDRAFT_141455 [Gelatoporia subvermispora B]|uniref:Amino acid transporter transmembrane domain-containing protein n=1 Tax=Ceriporiopsis subvermispora (strain B) TaxID=914234 RepID=M2QAQ4_CERS8|nr:hypothetical protein CERSUDRAFT_141455 [Gelatoporia subvermispora B]
MTSPSKPVNITSPRRRPADLPGTPPSRSFTVSGSPSTRALRAQYSGTPPPPNVPLRRSQATPDATGSSPLLNLVSASGYPSTPRPASSLSARRPSSGAHVQESATIDDLPDEEKARVLRRHLVSREERQRNGATTPTPAATPVGQRNSPGGSDSPVSEAGGISKRSSTSHLRMQREDTDPFAVPYGAPGADVTHNIYKWHADRVRQSRPRAASFAGSTVSTPHSVVAHLREPGGFRRHFLFRRAHAAGTEPPPVSRNFIEFLYLFGHFAGEDLEEEEEEEFVEERQDEEAQISAPVPMPSGAGIPGITLPSEAPDTHKGTEREPLLGRQRSASRVRRRRAASEGAHGDATVTQAVLMLLKSFVGTGILFLGKAFFNGGILFSSAILTFIALISLYSFLLLVKTKFVVSGSFGDIGGALYGPWMRYAILTSIVVSQLGFVSAYIIFVSENLQAFTLAITNCATALGIQYFIALQLIIFLPLALVRNLARLSTTALVADVFILAGLIYIFGSEAAIMGRRGTSHVELFNPKDWPLLIGTAVFSFEGIGLVIPITDAMREPRKFPRVLTGVMLTLMVMFCGAGIMSYLTFGSDVKTVVIVNLDMTSKFTQVVQFLYSLAILLSVPLQLFPAVRIMEQGIFQHSGKGNMRVKWLKNAFRSAIVIFCAFISWAGAADLDKFVSFIGSFACVPLCYVYPAMLHYKACARTRREKAQDIALMIFGMLAATYTTIQTVKVHRIIYMIYVAVLTHQL